MAIVTADRSNTATSLPPSSFAEFSARGVQRIAVPNPDALHTLREDLARHSAALLGVDCPDAASYLNHVHQYLKNMPDLNDHRLKLHQFLNATPRYKHKIYEAFRPIVDLLIGPDIAIQKRLNLVVHVPHAPDEVLQIHTDAEGGNSPFEIVFWIPLVDVYETKSIYILDRTFGDSVFEALQNQGVRNLDGLIEKTVRPSHYIELPYGEALLFSSLLIHGNSVNSTSETRWSLNVRFKNLFTPFGTKSFREHFELINLSPLTRMAMNSYNRASSS